MRTKVMWVSAAVSILVIALVGLAGWFAYRWFDASMSSVHVAEDADEAARIAAHMGVRPSGSEIDYGQVTSQFQGWPMAYLVVKADSTVVRDKIIGQSRLHCAATDPTTLASLRPQSDHGPPPSASLMTCTRGTPGYDSAVPADEPGGDLTVWCDPKSGDRSTWLYISAIPN